MSALFLVFFVVLGSGTPIGLNAGAQFDTSSVSLVATSGAQWVRLNFIVTPAQTGTSDPAFIAMYDSIINVRCFRRFMILCSGLFLVSLTVRFVFLRLTMLVLFVE